MTGNNTTQKTIAHAFGFRPGIDLDKLNQLCDELEAEAYASRMILPDVNVYRQTHIEISRRAVNMNEMRWMVIVVKQD
jgi:hypothetical protein